MIPMAGDVISQSQGDLLNNMEAINTLVMVNHAPFNTANQGKHIYVEMPVQVASPPIVFDAGEVALYSFLNPITSQNEMYVNKTNEVTATQIPATASILSTDSAPLNNTSGWSYLPSGILMKWGNANANGATFVAFPVAADIPVFAQVMSVQVTNYNTGAGDTNTYVSLSTFTNLGMNVYGSSRSAVGAAATSFQYLAIGY